MAALTLGTLTLCALNGDAKPEGLATSFVDVFLPDVTVGKPYDMALQQQRRIELQNFSKESITVRIDPVFPAKGLMEKAEAIPDLNWITVTPRELTIDAGDVATANLVIQVPDHRRFAHRLYQVSIWTRVIPVQTAGMTVAPGLLSHVRFQTIP